MTGRHAVQYFISRRWICPSMRRGHTDGGFRSDTVDVCLVGRPPPIHQLVKQFEKLVNTHQVNWTTSDNLNLNRTLWSGVWRIDRSWLGQGGTTVRLLACEVVARLVVPVSVPQRHLSPWTSGFLARLLEANENNLKTSFLTVQILRVRIVNRHTLTNNLLLPTST